MLYTKEDFNPWMKNGHCEGQYMTLCVSNCDWKSSMSLWIQDEWNVACGFKSLLHVWVNRQYIRMQITNHPAITLITSDLLLSGSLRDKLRWYLGPNFNEENAFNSVVWKWRQLSCLMCELLLTYRMNAPFLLWTTVTHIGSCTDVFNYIGNTYEIFGTLTVY